MTKNAWYIGTFSQIKVFIHWTFLLLIGYIVFTGVSAGLSAEDIIWHVLFIMTIFLCVVLHEYGHALMGRRFGFKTKDIVLLPIGGMARFEKLPEKPSQEFLVAIAGPLVNFAIAGLLFLLLLPTGETLTSLDYSSVNAGNFLLLLMTVNLALGIFNLIPAFPMDGGRILRAVLSMFNPRDVATRTATFIGRILAVGFGIFGLLYNPFLLLIAVFIFLAGSSETVMVEMQSYLRDHKAEEIIMHHYAILHPEDSLGDASHRILDSQDTNFLVMDEHEIVGTINREKIMQALAQKGELSLVRDHMNKKVFFVQAHALLKDLYMEPAMRKNDLAPVLKDGHIIGMINLENIIEYVGIQKALAQKQASIKSHHI